MFKKLILILVFAINAFSAHADNQSFITSVYGTITQKHITPVNLEELAIAGLKSISDVD